MALNDHFEASGALPRGKRPNTLWVGVAANTHMIRNIPLLPEFEASHFTD
jgi:hypothetical protein